MNKTSVYLEDSVFCVVCPVWDNQRAKDIPDRKWSPKNKRWEAPATLSNAKYLADKYRSSEMCNRTIELTHEMIEASKNRPPFPSWYQFKSEPLKCQVEALNRAFKHDEFAYIMDMGTGKTFTAINFGAAKAMMGEINGMLVVCDTTGKPVWRKEFEKFCPIDYDMFVMEQGKQNAANRWINTPSDRFKVLVLGVESLSTGPYAKEVGFNFLSKYTCYMAIDESSSIKNPKYNKKAQRQSRTHVCWDMGGLARFRAILNGTPIEEGVEDFFAQFRFLNWQIIGEKNFTLFKAKYCVMGGFENRKITGYMNLHELFERIAPYIYDVRITDVEDMPGQSYETVYCDPTPEQKKALKELGDPMMTTTQGDLELVCETILERMTRYQQIVGGYFPYDIPAEEKAMLRKSDPRHKVARIKGKNPKMEALFETINHLAPSRKAVVWANFAPERLDIVDECEKRGISFVHMGSGLSADEKYDLMEEFQTNDDIKLFITSQKIGAKSVTLHAATCSIYYSNGHSYSQREQSERRIWRKGQKYPCLYIDITMNEKTDLKIIKAHADKKSLAEYVMDEIKSHSEIT
ncbi:MAG: DEAD/DEAH box helicase [Gammaproteobacteria bacterium]|nr:DEAD/DEAH box helicase [Gammaproteobacteria bacterium]